MSTGGEEARDVDACFAGEDGGYDAERRSDHSNCNDCRVLDSSSLVSYSCSTPLKDSDKLRRIVIASAKGFVIGAGLKGGLALFSILARLKRQNALPSIRKVGVITNKEAIVTALKETLRYGLFLGSFAGTYVSVDEIIGTFGGYRRRVLFAGAVAGPSMLLTAYNTQHTSLAVYILMRAAVLASRCGIKSKRFGHICKPLTWSAYILNQESLSTSYKSFLNKNGGKDPIILEGVEKIASCMPFTNLKEIARYYKTVRVDIKLDLDMKIPCLIVHGNESCGGHVLSFLVQAYKRAVPAYLPMYLVPPLIVHRKDLLKDLTRCWQRGFLALQDQVDSYLYIAHLPGCGHVCSLGFSGDATSQSWQWERSQQAWP